MNPLESLTAELLDPATLEQYDWLRNIDITDESFSRPFARDWLYKSPTIEQIQQYPQELYLGSATLSNFDFQHPSEDTKVLETLKTYDTLISEYTKLRAKLIQFTEIFNFFISTKLSSN